MRQIKMSRIPLSEASAGFWNRVMDRDDLVMLMHLHAVYWIYAPEIQRGMWSNDATNILYGSDAYFKNFDWGPGIKAILEKNSEASIGLRLHLQQLTICAQDRTSEVSICGPAGLLLPGLPHFERSGFPIEILLTPVLLQDEVYGLVRCCMTQVIELSNATTARMLKLTQSERTASFLFDKSGLLLTHCGGSSEYDHIDRLQDIVTDEMFQEISLNVCNDNIGYQKVHKFNEIWTHFEAHPCKDPMTLELAILLQMSDVTDLKQQELAAVVETERINLENIKLREIAQSILNRRTLRSDIVSLADKICAFLKKCVGREGLDEALTLQEMMLVTDDIYAPLDLMNHLRKTNMDLEEDVLSALIGLAQPSNEIKTIKNVHNPTQNDSPINNDSSLDTPRRSWNVADIGFDVCELDEECNGNALSKLAMFLFESHDLITKFNLNVPKLITFLNRIQSGYSRDSYHNSVHAANVLWMTNYLLDIIGLQKDPLKVLSVLTAAIIHDFEHRGVTNDFLITVQDPIAIRYNDSSPQENHHVAAAFGLMKHHQCDFMENVNAKDFSQIRALIIELVLATDMRHHFSIVNHFNSMTQKPGTDTAVDIIDTPHCDKIVLKMILKCADIGHVFQPWDKHVTWVDRLQEEFWRQGDKERALGLKVSSLMDRNTERNVVQSQVGFLKLFACPALDALSTAFPQTQIISDNLSRNCSEWAKVGPVGF